MEEIAKVPEKEEAKVIIEDANKSLNHFILKPPELKGKNSFDHMIKYRGRHLGATEPSLYLGVDVSKLQMSVIQPTEEELTQGRIMRDTVGMGAQLKLVKSKLDNLGYIKSQSGIQNNKTRLQRLENQMEMVSSLAEINTLKDQEKVDKLENLK